MELACALADVFDPERDRILWDVGHQSYAWKLLTKRRRPFSTLRQFGGESPFVNPDESAADAFVAGHAGNALAAALALRLDPDCIPATGEEYVRKPGCPRIPRKVISWLVRHQVA